jgi:rhodanese-related sulfurtransferase
VIQIISGSEAVTAANQPETVLLDLRSPAEIAASGTAQGAMCMTTIDLSRLFTAANTIEARRLITAQQIIVYFAVGARAGAAAELLVSKGLKNVSAFNAFCVWVSAGGAVQTA